MEKYFKYDDEYITGWTYFLRSILNSLLSLFLIGIYLNSVTAYKRARSLGHNDTATLWGIWGFLAFPLAFTPLALITNTIPHWYLWFSNGPGEPGETQLDKQVKKEAKENILAQQEFSDSSGVSVENLQNKLIDKEQKESIIPKKAIKNSDLRTKKSKYFDFQYEELLSFEGNLEHISDPEDDMYDYAYWYSFIKGRAEFPNNLYDTDEALVEGTAWGHCDEYSKRLIAENLDDKKRFIKPRIICYGKILDLLEELKIKIEKKYDEKKLNSRLKLEVLHAKASVYGAIKFAQQNNITKAEIKSWYPGFVDNIEASDAPHLKAVRELFVGDDANTKLYQIYELSEKEKSEIPFWFRKGLFLFGFFKKGKTIKNKSKSIKLNRLERGFYFHYLQFSMLLDNMPEFNKAGDYEFGNYELYIETFEIKELILHWFKENNKKAYDILFDIKEDKD